MSRARKATPLEARRFLRRAHLMDSRAADIGTVIAHHGYIQIDPINICGRMHDHILRNRVHAYGEDGLMRHLHGAGERLPPGKRSAFEHHLPGKDILVAFPLDAWPHLQAAMRARTRAPGRWMGRLTPREKEFAALMMEKFQSEGGLGPEDFDDERKGRRVWGAATLAKSTLQKLFFHGRLLISGRQNNRRIYDLPERVLPAAALAAPESNPDDVARWLALTRLRQHRLVALTRAERALVGDLIHSVEVEGCPLLFCLQEDIGLFEPAEAVDDEPLLLAPLDPMIYDRRVTQHLWEFSYSWEAYTPPAKRKRGYYALPILSGIELVGHVDMKADRGKRRLGIVSRKVRRGHSTAKAIKRLAQFLGLRTP